jgi:hypothetical protein
MVGARCDFTGAYGGFSCVGGGWDVVCNGVAFDVATWAAFGGRGCVDAGG